MPASGRKWFWALGSQEIYKLKYREGYAFIGVSGKLQAKEKRSKSKFDSVSVQQMFLVKGHNLADISHLDENELFARLINEEKAREKH